MANLFIDDSRPTFDELFYVVEENISLLGGPTSLIYKVLLMGRQVPTEKRIGSIRTDGSKEFPKFKMDPVKLEVDESVPPSRNMFYNVSEPLRGAVRDQIKEMLSEGIIEEVTSEMRLSWCSGGVAVPKGKDEVRLVIDLRRVNKAIIRQPFAMPTMESIMIDMGKNKFLSTLDLRKAFHHVELDEDSRHLTNFYMDNKIYRFKRLPFGLSASPDIFQEALQRKVLMDAEGVVVYLDDILIKGRTEKEHDDRVENVLRLLNNHNAQINFKKSRIKKDEVLFLGFKVGKDGWSMSDEKCEALRKMSKPQNGAEVKSLLGLVAHGDTFLVWRARETERLRELARAGTPFKWDEEANREFECIRTKMIDRVQKLQFYDVKAETELWVDGCKKGLGAVLVQLDENKKPNIVACASKALTPTERRYAQCDIEALAVYWGVRRFTRWLYGMKFTLVTDASANQGVYGPKSRFKNPNRPISRTDVYALNLQQYDFTIRMVSSQGNIADALSRMVSQRETNREDDEDMGNAIFSIGWEDASEQLAWSEITRESEKDKDIVTLVKVIQSGNWTDIKDRMEAFKPFRRTLATHSGMVFNDDKVLLPFSLRKREMARAHRTHVGASATECILRARFWWINMRENVKLWIRKCDRCQRDKGGERAVTLRMREVPEEPWAELEVSREA